MSLTATDFKEIRTILREEVSNIVPPIVREEVSNIVPPIVREEVSNIVPFIVRAEVALEAIENDVREIYYMLAKLQKATFIDKQFQKRSLEDKLLKNKC